MILHHSLYNEIQHFSMCRVTVDKFIRRGKVHHRARVVLMMLADIDDRQHSAMRTSVDADKAVGMAFAEAFSHAMAYAGMAADEAA